MGKDIYKMNEKISTLHLHLELKDENLSCYQKRMLNRYGESTSGGAITRDLLIPSNMPLHNLHYAIQKSFGWQNSHLRAFYLPRDIYKKLTGGTVRGWSDLVGILFQPPSEAEYDIFWDDDYQKGSISAWLKKKYTGPYIYGGEMEGPVTAKKDVEELLDRFKIFEVKESFHDFFERSKREGDAEIKILRKAPLIDLTLEEMNSSLIIDGGTESLLERLEVDKVIGYQDEDISSNKLFPITKELIYNYDFGDDWLVAITKYRNCDKLLTLNAIDENELEEAENTVLSKYRPACIHKEGVFVFDDVGGLGGFADFLGILYEGEDKEDKYNTRAWAKSLGWNDSKISNKMIL